MKTTIIGGGVMGEAILGAALEAGVLESASTTVCEIVPARREAIAARYGVAVSDDASESMAGAEVVLLAVKPQDSGKVRGFLPASAFVISVMAGVTADAIRGALGHSRIVRVMPNTPVAARAGMSVWTATNDVDESQRAFTRRLLASFGEELYVDDEDKIDMATAVSGSGPAYVFLFIEALIDGAVTVGLPRAYAEKMVLQTVFGSATYAKASASSAADLRAQVTSPGGTTAAGLYELERGALRAAVIDAVRAAHRRARELGGHAR